jgi:Txe/YoeB family toxin of Txe-Axe toxin-antitoxin module
MSQVLILTDALSSDSWKKKEKKEKKKEKWTGAFSPRPEAVHTLMAVLGRIFAAFRCNNRLI